MLFEQELDYSTTTPQDRYIPLCFPAGTPPPFNTGVWKAGWAEVGGNKDVLALKWHSVEARGGPDSFRLSFHDRNRLCWEKKVVQTVFPSQGCYQSEKIPSTRAEISISVEVETECKAQPGCELAKRFAAFSVAQTTNDVLLDFPRSGRQIWTSEKVLSESPYFASLFSSDFLESTTSQQASSQSGDSSSLPFDDSDDEDKAGLVKDVKSTRSSPAPSVPFKTVSITEASYSTYLAVVCWMQSGQIAFAPLTSSAAPSGVSSGAAAEASSEQGPPPTPSSLLLPVSPKSVYRLSHLLELPSLSSLALFSFTSQLTTQHAAHELFSETSGCYDEIRQAALDFTLQHIKDVAKSEGMKAAAQRAEKGSMAEWEGAIWAQLAMKLATKESRSGRSKEKRQEVVRRKSRNEAKRRSLFLSLTTRQSNSENERCYFYLVPPSSTVEEEERQA